MRRFNNIENKCYKTICGKEIWDSRSCAVVNFNLLLDKELNSPHILMVKRGIACPDEIGKWCVPCGYIDWNETSNEAAQRETWEETGFEYESDSIIKFLYSDLNSNSQPWFVRTDPNSNKQNINLYHGAIFICNSLPELTNENALENEVQEVRWIPLFDIIGEKNPSHFFNTEDNSHISPSLSICFNHDVRIWQFVRDIARPTILKSIIKSNELGIETQMPHWLFNLKESIPFRKKALD